MSKRIFSFNTLSVPKFFSCCIFCFAFCTNSFAVSPTQVHVRGQIGKAKIDSVNKTIFAQVNYYGKKGVYPLSRAAIDIFKVPDGTTHTLADTVDLRHWHEFKINEETWKIKAGYQLPGSDFSKWHTEDVRGFATFGRVSCEEMVGSEKQRIWDNGNPAYSTSGSKTWPTYKVKLNDGSYAAELRTRRIFGIIASGNLFTGRIVRDMSLKQLLGFTDKDGKALIRWGVPFEGRPKGFRVKFKYDGKGDSCTVMATLENHSNKGRRFIAAAWYSGKTDFDKSREGVVSISKSDKNGLRTLETKFIYGRPHKNADPFPDGVLQGNADETITHINVVFASSRKGDYFKGVKDASLIVKDFELVY